MRPLHGRDAANRVGCTTFPWPTISHEAEFQKKISLPMDSSALFSAVVQSPRAEKKRDSSLRENLVNDVSLNVCQPKIPTAVPIRQPFVIDPEQMKHGRVQIMDVAPLFHCPETEIIGSTVRHSALHSTARQQRTKAVNIVIAPVTNLFEAAVLDHRRPT